MLSTFVTFWITAIPAFLLEKGDNFCGILFPFLHAKSHLKRGLL